MSNPKLGTKHICKSCDTRFFDMKKSPAVCPKCGTEVKEAKVAKAKRPAPEAEPTPAVAPAKESEPKNDPAAKDGGDGEQSELEEELAELLPADDDDTDEDALDDDEEEDGLIEDASDLSEVDDDLSEVREHMDDGSTDKG